MNLIMAAFPWPVRPSFLESCVSRVSAKYSGTCECMKVNTREWGWYLGKPNVCINVKGWIIASSYSHLMTCETSSQRWGYLCKMLGRKDSDYTCISWKKSSSPPWACWSALQTSRAFISCIVALMQFQRVLHCEWMILHHMEKILILCLDSR